MRTLLASIALVFVAVTAQGCSPGAARQIVKSAIDITLASCIAEHADISDEPALREVCRWTDDLAPLVKELLSARAKGLSKSRGAACAPGSAKP